MALPIRMENGFILTDRGNPHLHSMLCDNAELLIASLR